MGWGGNGAVGGARTEPDKRADDPWQFAIAGVGPRRWLALGDAPALGLPVRAVRDRWQVRLPAVGFQAAAATALQKWQAWRDAGLAVAGYLGYDLGAALEGVPPVPRRGPLPDADLCAFAERDLQALTLPPVSPQTALPLPQAFVDQQQAFLAQVAAALAAIRAGEVYQVNLSVAAACAIADNPSLPRLLAGVMAVQPVPLALVWQGLETTVVSASMEPFLRVVGPRVQTRPIKGTAARAAEPDRDRELARRLAASRKERAENTMIVDMARNDLQRAAHWQSVGVAALCEPTPYSTLWHLESEVHATLREPRDRKGLFAATLPPASVTGCPKIQATRLIARLESRWRGPYCGALGLELQDGRLDLAVGIRQLWLQPGQATLHVGAGIVAQSQPAKEWRELCLKAEGALRLLATVAVEPG